MPITKLTSDGAQCSEYQCAVEALNGRTDSQGVDTYTQCECGAFQIAKKVNDMMTLPLVASFMIQMQQHVKQAVTLKVTLKQELRAQLKLVERLIEQGRILEAMAEMESLLAKFTPSQTTKFRLRVDNVLDKLYPMRAKEQGGQVMSNALFLPLLRYGDEARRSGDLQRAIRKYRDALQYCGSFQERSQVLQRLADVYFKWDALNYFILVQKGAFGGPYDVIAQLSRQASELEKSGDLKAAANMHEQIAEIFFKEGVWQYAAGECENAAVLLEKAGNKDAAMNVRLRAIEITGKQLGSDALSESGRLVRLAKLYEKVGNFEMAAQSYAEEYYFWSSYRQPAGQLYVDAQYRKEQAIKNRNDMLIRATVEEGLPQQAPPPRTPKMKNLIAMNLRNIQAYLKYYVRGWNELSDGEKKEFLDRAVREIKVALKEPHFVHEHLGPDGVITMTGIARAAAYNDIMEGIKRQRPQESPGAARAAGVERAETLKKAQEGREGKEEGPEKEGRKGRGRVR